MELDELKARWQKESEENLNLNNQTMEQLETMLRTKTSDTLGQVKQKYRKIIEYLMVGLLLNAAISPFLHFLLGEEGPVFRITAGGILSLTTLLLLGLIVIFFYFNKYSNFETEVYDQNLKATIQAKIRALNRSLSAEIKLIVLIFIAIVVISRLSSEYLGHGNFADVFHIDIILSFLAFIAVFSFYVLSRVKHYRRYTNSLKTYLNELDKPQVE